MTAGKNFLSCSGEPLQRLKISPSACNYRSCFSTRITSSLQGMPRAGFPPAPTQQASPGAEEPGRLHSWGPGAVKLHVCNGKVDPSFVTWIWELHTALGQVMPCAISLQPVISFEQREKLPFKCEECSALLIDMLFVGFGSETGMISACLCVGNSSCHSLRKQTPAK